MNRIFLLLTCMLLSGCNSNQPKNMRKMYYRGEIPPVPSEQETFPG